MATEKGFPLLDFSSFCSIQWGQWAQSGKRLTFSPNNLMNFSVYSWIKVQDSGLAHWGWVSPVPPGLKIAAWVERYCRKWQISIEVYMMFPKTPPTASNNNTLVQAAYYSKYIFCWTIWLPYSLVFLGRNGPPAYDLLSAIANFRLHF